MTPHRTSQLERKTAETQIALKINLDGTGKHSIHTGVGFLDHMLVLFAKHALIDLEVQAQGDLQVDAHHTTEDIAICLGHTFRDALGDNIELGQGTLQVWIRDESPGLPAHAQEEMN